MRIRTYLPLLMLSTPAWILVRPQIYRQNQGIPDSLALLGARQLATSLLAKASKALDQSDQILAHANIQLEQMNSEMLRISDGANQLTESDVAKSEEWLDKTMESINSQQERAKSETLIASNAIQLAGQILESIDELLGQESS